MPETSLCLVGLDNLPVLAPEFRGHAVGGESVQQTLLGRALVRRGHEVSMVTADCGQEDGAVCWGIRVYKAYRPAAGVPLLRFVHPRWTGLWSALKRADAQLYYTSCAGMHLGLLALFCARHGRRCHLQHVIIGEIGFALHHYRYVQRDLGLPGVLRTADPGRRRRKLDIVEFVS